MQKINSKGPKESFLILLLAALLLAVAACTQRRPAAQTGDSRRTDSILASCKDTASLTVWAERLAAQNDLKGAMQMKKEKGNRLYNYALYHESVDAYSDALRDAQEIKDTLEMVWILNKLGKVFRHMMIADEAVSCHLRALRYCEQYSNKKSAKAARLRAKAYTGIGSAYMVLGDNEKASIHFNKSQEIEQRLNNYRGQGVNYAKMGKIRESEGDLAAAAHLYTLALECNRKGHDEIGRTTTHKRFGYLAELHSDWAGAQREYEQALEIARSQNDIHHVIELLLALGHTQLAGGHAEEARRYLQEAIGHAETATSFGDLAAAYRLLAQCDEQQDRGKALQDYRTSMAYSDSLHGEKNQLRTQRFLMKYEKEKGLDELNSMRQGFQSKQKTKDYIIAIAAALFLLAVAAILSMAYALKQRKRAQALQANMEKMRSDFFTNVTHEFRTPLTVINGLSELIKGEVDDPEVSKQVDIIIRQGHQLLQLVNQLLDISKIRSSVGNATWRECNLVAMLSMAIESMNVLAAQKMIDIVFAKDESAIIMDLVPDYINKILNNLLMNAIKYTPRGGKIVVRVKKEERQVTIVIFDNGSGISEEELAFVFDQYYQGTLQTGYLGTGIGLSMVRQMTEAMGGKVSAYSVESRGTAFEITLPLKHAAGRQRKWEPMPSPEQAASSYQIDALFPADRMADESKPSALIVEDNADVATYIGTILMDDYNLRYARNGKEALEKIDEFVTDVIVSDIIMPEMDGIEFARSVRASEKSSHIPIVIITAKSEEKDRLEALQAGVDSFLLKPFLPEELKLELSKLLAQRQQLKEKYGNEAIEGLEDETMNYDRRNQFLSRLHEVVHAEMNDTSFNSEKLASKLCISRSQLNRKVKSMTGTDTSTFIRDQRLAMARKLLKQTDIPISDIVVKCGFEYQTYFNRVFKAKFGETPTQARGKKEQADQKESH